MCVHFILQTAALLLWFNQQQIDDIIIIYIWLNSLLTVRNNYVTKLQTFCCQYVSQILIIFEKDLRLFFSVFLLYFLFCFYLLLFLFYLFMDAWWHNQYLTYPHLCIQLYVFIHVYVSFIHNHTGLWFRDLFLNPWAKNEYFNNV